jgi:hypothetical protein
VNRKQIENAEAVAERLNRYRANVARARRIEAEAEADRWVRPRSLATQSKPNKRVFDFTDEQMMIAIASLEKHGE